MVPVFAGANRALIRLQSGDYVAIDTGSIDAIPYLLGQPPEPQALFVFRCFLKPDTVFLDIGANFGLYTAVAAGVIGDRGRIYAFEGNPHTFEVLLWTIYANGRFSRRNIVPVNALVSDKSGRGTLHFVEKALGGATMTKPSEATVREFARVNLPMREIENEMTTIDAYLPTDLQVDLVKMDIEGHEPLAMRGMASTIARSPAMRLIIEFNDQFLEKTVSAAKFLEQIRDWGFGVCRIMADGSLRQIAPGEPLTGACELLLTRTPEQDLRIVEARRRRLPVRLGSWLRRKAAEAGDFWRRF